MGWFTGFIRDTVTAGTFRLAKLTGTYTATVAHHYAGVAEQRAKQNAPWSDRTGSARGGLMAEAGIEGTSVYITLAHSVDYGLWLEVRWNGRYAIIMPTLEEIMPEFEHALGGFGSIHSDEGAGTVTVHDE